MRPLLLTILLLSAGCADAFDAAAPGVDAVLRGSFTVQNNADIAFLAGYSEVTGTLAIEGDGLVDVTLPTVRRAGAVWLRDSPDLEAVVLPGLHSAGSIRVRGAPRLELLSAEMLEAVGDALDIVGCNGPAELPVEIDVPRLRRIDGDVRVWSNANLSQCDAEELVARVQAAGGVGGSVTVSDNAACE